MDGSAEIRCALEHRFDDDRLTPGTLNGVLLTYEQRARTRPELFRRAALVWPEDGVILNRMHSRSMPIIRFVPEVVDDEVRIAIPLPDTSAGRDAATEVRNGTLRGLSVEFRAIHEEHRGGLRVITRAELRGAGLVDRADYGDRVEVRHQKVRRLWL